ncbi:hypothetical protein [Niabella ginsengisoli]|uniref:Uncharacterized protein n=1 Tax=Niabella ginsengisoli TaxID=522298 RepID=A0ABS9SH52_9BACT|nr:hypothetical protein [Niabella ginsengisoli]MCH5597484.1 hypothetical protein [Niabella ginsengisoli]
MKISLLLLLILFGTGLSAQTFSAKTIGKVLDFNKKEHDYLVGKDFVLSTPNNEDADGKFVFTNPTTKEWMRLNYILSYEKEGGRHAQILYYLKNEVDYKKFVSGIKANGYKYSKLNKAYLKRDGTYHSQKITVPSLTIGNDGETFVIGYEYHLGKELSGVPGSEPPKPPIIKSKTDRSNVQQKTCTSEHLLQKILALPEVKERSKLLDLLTQKKQNLSFMIDETDRLYEIVVGYNGPLRWEPFYHFKADKKDCVLKIMDIESGEYMSVEAWRKLNAGKRVENE